MLGQKVCMLAWMEMTFSSQQSKWKRMLDQTCGSINFRGVINIILCTDKEDKIKICVAVWKNLFTNNTCRRWRLLQTFSTYRVSLYKKVKSELQPHHVCIEKVLILSSINLCVCVPVDLLCVLCNTKSHCFFLLPTSFFFRMTFFCSTLTA